MVPGGFHQRVRPRRGPCKTPFYGQHGWRPPQLMKAANACRGLVTNITDLVHLGPICSMPFMYFLSTCGTVIEPEAF